MFYTATPFESRNWLFYRIYFVNMTLTLSSFQITLSKRMPVIVFIHGGAFKLGSSQSILYGPEYLLDEDIVLVAINYRLGVFGKYYSLATIY